jgi:hypothetical protein
MEQFISNSNSKLLNTLIQYFNLKHICCFGPRVGQNNIDRQTNKYGFT